MSSDDLAISVVQLCKRYEMYDTPRDRLRQFVSPRLARLAGQAPRQFFKEFWALRDVSFDVRKGESVGIVGRNGSGKSTLLQMICGTLNPTSGSVQTNGRIAALLELGSGFNPEFTGRENVYMNGAVLGLDRDEIDRRFDSIAAFADIGEFIEQPVKTYSSGMAVRLAFAVAANVDPQILVVDEALSVGDELFQRKCFSRIEAIRNSGSTILFVSHSGAQIVELCDRAILLDAGEKLAIGLPKKIVGSYQRLLYATEVTRSTIRNEIAHARDLDVAQDAEEAIAPLRPVERAPEQLESFDPQLTPSSTMEYESRGAYIQSPTILTLDGAQVNNLVSGNSYRYTYTVRFERSAINVRFAMLIKTPSGVELGGAESASANGASLTYVEAGACYQVEFRFRCTLNPGVYFLNSGVLGDVDGSVIYLHRVMDIAAFTVMPQSGGLATGTIDFGCFAHIQPLRSPQRSEAANGQE
jgi:lipopolysaccharide transport system ATP-binding protein